MSCFLVPIALACSHQEQAVARGEQSSETPARFVQSFYDWYTPIATTEDEVPGWISALQSKRDFFTPELAQALEADREAQVRAEDEIVGLDADPFLNSQDPCTRYEVGKVSRKGESYWVDVHGECSGERGGTPDVVAEVVLKSGSWVFVNFHYPREQSDLLALLRRLRLERQ